MKRPWRVIRPNEKLIAHHIVSFDAYNPSIIYNADGVIILTLTDGPMADLIVKAVNALPQED